MKLKDKIILHTSGKAETIVLTLTNTSKPSLVTLYLNGESVFNSPISGECILSFDMISGSELIGLSELEIDYEIKNSKDFTKYPIKDVEKIKPIEVEKIPVSKLDIDSIIAELEKRYDLTPKK